MCLMFAATYPARTSAWCCMHLCVDEERTMDGTARRSISPRQLVATGGRRLLRLNAPSRPIRGLLQWLPE